MAGGGKKPKKKLSKAAYRTQIADKAVSAAKKSGSKQDKRIAKKAIKRKKSSPKATYKNIF